MQKYTIPSVLGLLLLVVLVPVVSESAQVIKGAVVDLLLYGSLILCVCFFVRYHWFSRPQKIYVLISSESSPKAQQGSETVLNPTEEVGVGASVAKSEQVSPMQPEIMELKRQQRERRVLMEVNFNDMSLSTPDQRLLDHVVDSIRRNIGNPDFNVENLSAEVGLSRVHLNRKLKELIDTNPSNLIKSTRLKQSLSMLTQPGVAISDVAYAVGFSTSAYFSASFQQYFGLLPKEFIVLYRKTQRVIW